MTVALAPARSMAGQNSSSIEYKINPAWSVKAEYQRVDFSKDHVDATADTFRVGVNFFVGGGYDPLK